MQLEPSNIHAKSPSSPSWTYTFLLEFGNSLFFGLISYLKLVNCIEFSNETDC